MWRSCRAFSISGFVIKNPNMLIFTSSLMPKGNKLKTL
jgi:hypothetical protein